MLAAAPKISRAAPPAVSSPCYALRVTCACWAIAWNVGRKARAMQNISKAVAAVLALARRNVTSFRVLYFGVALYTLRHSALGFATIEPSASIAWALLAALVVDIGMLLAAEHIRERKGAWMITGLILSCLLSAFSQLLFAATNAGALAIAPGAAWMDTFATKLIEWRVVLLPLAMPALVVVYAFASKEQAPAQEDAPQAEQAPSRAATYRDRIVDMLRQNPRLSDDAVQKAVGCKDKRTVKAARRAMASGATAGGGE